MKPKTSKPIELNPDFANFKALTKQILSVPKKEIDRRQKEYEAARDAKKASKN